MAIGSRTLTASIGIAALVGSACHKANTETPVTVGNITIEQAYAPEPVTPDVGALYFTVRNSGDEDRLLAVTVDLADDVSLHDQDRSAAGTRMVGVDSINVPAHGVMSLEPGSYHAMLRELKRHYREGDSLAVTAHFARAGNVTFFAPVVSYVDVAERMNSAHHAERH